MTVILSFPQYQQQAEQLAEALSLSCHVIDIHYFPDQESRVTLPLTTTEHAIIYCGLEYPNNKLVELMLAVNTLKQLGCNRTSLVSPYLCYMRQDKAFNQGEAISQQIIAGFLSELFDNVITVDAHLHRVKTLDEIFPQINSVHISAASIFSQVLAEQGNNSVLLGPDEESEQWVKSIAAHAGLPHLVARKVRHGDRHVTISLPEYDYAHKDVILIDDVISSGQTMIEAALQLKQASARSIKAMVSHALFNEATQRQLEQSGIETVLSSNSIPHPSNHIDIIPLIAKQVTNWLD